VTEDLREDEHEREDRQDGDVPARHVGGKSHRQREGPHEHADDLDGDQNRIDEDGTHAVRNQVLPVLNEAVRPRPATMMATNVMLASAAVTLKLPVAVAPPCSMFGHERVLLGVQHQVIESPSSSKIGTRPIALATR
jgi:hypothetical protein